MEAPDVYLVRRFDRPLAWAKVFAVAGLAVGLAIGAHEAGVQGALVGIAFGALIGGVIGSCLGHVVYFSTLLVGGLDRPVRRPDLWAIHLRCGRCGWENGPGDPWTVRDCMTWQHAQCRHCGGYLVMAIPDCPSCGQNPTRGKKPLAAMRALFRIPKTWDQAIRGHFSCKNCGCMFDKWGREVAQSATDAG